MCLIPLGFVYWACALVGRKCEVRPKPQYALVYFLEVSASIKEGPVLPQEPGPNLSPHPPTPQRLGPLFPQ